MKKKLGSSSFDENEAGASSCVGPGSRQNFGSPSVRSQGYAPASFSIVPPRRLGIRTFLVCFVFCLLLLSACSTTTNANLGGAASNPATTAHMNEMQFTPDLITLKKGDKLTIVDDVAVIHVIQNGRWDSNGTQRPGAEPGAPTVQLQFNGDDQQTVGPFTKVGTFHLYCTIHNDMNLTVVVK